MHQARFIAAVDVDEFTLTAQKLVRIIIMGPRSFLAPASIRSAITRKRAAFYPDS